MKKSVGLVLGGSAVVAGGLYLATRPIARLANNLDYEIDIQAKWGTLGVEITLQIKLKNPTSTVLSFNQPYITISGKKNPNTERGDFLVSQDGISERIITLQRFQSVDLEPITFAISYTQLPGLIHDKMNEIRSEGKFTIYIRMMTALRVGDRWIDGDITVDRATYIPDWARGILGSVPELHDLGFTAPQRILKRGGQYDHLMPSPTGISTDIADDADTYTTIHHIAESYVPQVAWQTADLAPVLRGRTVAQTCQNIWNFLYDHIQYVRDPKGVELLRSPRQLWADRQNGGDCDCTSIMTATILDNLGIPYAYRKTRYSSGWQHIYIVVPKRAGADLTKRDNYWVIDHVVDDFDYEVPYTQSYELINTAA